MTPRFCTSPSRFIFGFSHFTFFSFSWIPARPFWTVLAVALSRRGLHRVTGSNHLLFFLSVLSYYYRSIYIFILFLSICFSYSRLFRPSLRESEATSFLFWQMKVSRRARSVGRRRRARLALFFRLTMIVRSPFGQSKSERREALCLSFPTTTNIVHVIKIWELIFLFAASEE